jgi:PAS domain S-box-containing protein
MTRLLFNELHRQQFAKTLNITLKFVGGGILWIVLSDLAVFIFHLPGGGHFPLFHIEIVKGIFFVIVMGVIFFLVLQRHRLTANAFDQQEFFKENSQPMWVYNLETLRFLEVNEAAVKVYGYSRKEFLSMTISEIRPAEEIPRLKEANGQLQNGHRIFGRRKHLRKDGALIHAEVSAYSIIYQNQHAGLILSNDITEQINAQEALRRANLALEKKIHDKTSGLKLTNKELEVRNREINATNDDLIDLNNLLLETNKKFYTESTTALQRKTDHLKRVFDQMTDSAWSFDLTGMEENYVSKSALKLFGLSESEIIDCPNFWMRFIHPHDKPAIREKLKDLEHHDTEFSYRIVDGQKHLKTIHQRVWVVYDNDGSAIRIGCLASEAAPLSKNELMSTIHYS